MVQEQEDTLGLVVVGISLRYSVEVQVVLPIMALRIHTEDPEFLFSCQVARSNPHRKFPEAVNFDIPLPYINILISKHLEHQISTQKGVVL